jgi:hypothetical protein
MDEIAEIDEVRGVALASFMVSISLLRDLQAVVF